MTRPPLAQIANYRQQIIEGGYDHADMLHASRVLGLLADVCASVQSIAAQVEDAELRAALLAPLYGVPSYLADAAGDVAVFFNRWDELRGDRVQDAEDNKAADAADARMAL
jgi:hypothetical protein